MSWFRRKSKNRSFTRARVLDVKLRSDQRRRNRLRLGTWILLSTAVLLFGSVAAWRGFDLLYARLLTHNPRFSIHHIEVHTDGVIALEQIRYWSGVRLNQNLFAVDPARVRRDLELVPVIESASVERVLPDRLAIYVTEREPIARYLPPQTDPAEGQAQIVYQLDRHGYLMLPLESQQRSVPAPAHDLLPQLIGLPPSDVRLGRPAESPQVHAALRLVEAFERSPMVGLVDCKRIDVSLPGVLTLTTAQGSELTFGLSEFDTQLRRWRLVHDYALSSGRYVGTLDLSVSNNLPARWLQASVVPPPAPVLKPKPPSPYKKRHV